MISKRKQDYKVLNQKLEKKKKKGSEVGRNLKKTG